MIYLQAIAAALAVGWMIELSLRLRRAKIQVVRLKHEVRVQGKTIDELALLLAEAKEESDGHISVVTMLMDEIEWMGPRAPRALPAGRRHLEIVQGEVIKG